MCEMRHFLDLVSLGVMRSFNTFIEVPIDQSG